MSDDLSVMEKQVISMMRAVTAGETSAATDGQITVTIANGKPTQATCSYTVRVSQPQIGLRPAEPQDAPADPE